MKKTLLACTAFICAVLSISSLTAWAADSDQQAAAQPEETPAPPSLYPGMAGPLAFSQKPLSTDLGQYLGKWYLTGVASGLGFWQSNHVQGDQNWRGDVSNGQLMINKPDGLVQIFAQVGAYSLPALGTAYIPADQAIHDFYGPFPQGFLKLQLTDSLSVMGGKLPTLIGAEYTFTFENMNIERGLLWNQENAVNRGGQINYVAGPVTLAASWNDGFYSNVYSWASGSASWAIDSGNTLSFIGGGNTRHTSTSSIATPVFQNNQQIYNLIYTHANGPWTITPYFQFTHVPEIHSIGAFDTANTVGFALLMDYRFTDDTSNVAGLPLSGFSLPVRVELIASTGSASDGSPNLLYGVGSKAFSVTVTPTYQYNFFFVRPEFSFTGAFDTTSGLAFGSNGNNNNQARLMLEGGVIF